ncbi:SusD/RagB family nutrient-binding outer membrane lipoprotein [Flammeovirga aprica]|uniref:SusD/RagB family nutrient-binding outer membrane lipoprotein n=1 Tax=Flammeovirga aprica JL-4 TaxID=694437 RepID=A0A7X9RSJ9_9BACT|nr:SusD/RagB family nutrient-binding outer membrane lipoprotein [Flammeovirga aprica]NME67320.1 SusD/RagB family nutrient-binding outer membrane lipoprotein [Flammeovirga aprica JL-4]
MEKFKYIKLLLIGVMISLASCSEDVLDEINRNPNNPLDTPSQFVITDAMNASLVRVANGDYAFYASLFIEHQVGVFNQFHQAEIRLDASLTQATTYNSAWVGSYQAMRNLKDVIAKCSEGGAEVGNNHTLGVAQILMAYNLSVVTDMCGDIPWSQALDPVNYLRPDLDKQEAIYTDIFKLLDDGVANLEKDNDGNYDAIGVHDMIYGNLRPTSSNGNDQVSWRQAWVKLAWGLRARFTMRLSHKTPNYADVLAHAAKSFTSAADEAKSTYNGSTSYNPYYLMYTQRDYYGSSQSMRNNMDDNDPRIANYFIPYPKSDPADEKLEFAPNGDIDQIQGVYGISSYFNNRTENTFIMSYHELLFLIAEATARNNGSAAEIQTATVAAVRAALASASIAQADIDAYITYIEGNKTFDVDYVMKEKYISQYISESLEAYNDYRRLKAMNGGTVPTYVTFLNPQPAKFPLRMTYGADDVNNNQNVRDALGDGQYVYTENVWWAGGSR